MQTFVDNYQLFPGGQSFLPEEKLFLSATDAYN